MPYQTVQQAYFDIPVITRTYTTACLFTTVALQLEILSPFQLYFNPTLIARGQIWRLITTFLFFGNFGFTFLFNMLFTYRYCRMLEEGSFRNRTADFVVFILFGFILMTLTALVVNLLFFGHAFTMMLVYVWARRNPYIRMNFFGLLIFQAPYLPWVLLAFSFLLGNPVAVDIMGIIVGHIYFFLEDVYPNQEGGMKLIRTPQFLKNLLDERPEEAAYAPLDDATADDDDERGPRRRPAGFRWGEGEPLGGQANGHANDEQ